MEELEPSLLCDEEFQEIVRSRLPGGETEDCGREKTIDLNEIEKCLARYGSTSQLYQTRK